MVVWEESASKNQRELTLHDVTTITEENNMYEIKGVDIQSFLMKMDPTISKKSLLLTAAENGFLVRNKEIFDQRVYSKVLLQKGDIPKICLSIFVRSDMSWKLKVSDVDIPVNCSLQVRLPTCLSQENCRSFFQLLQQSNLCC